MKVCVIRTDGQEEELRVGNAGALAAIKALIGAETLDTVNLRDGRVMLVDDDGWETETVEIEPGKIELRPIKALKPLNEKATKIYHGVCVEGTTHQIVGDVAIVLDHDFA